MYDITSAVAHYEKVLRSQLERLDRIKAEGDFVDFNALPVLRIGVCGGDGIGPSITREAARVLAKLLDEEIKAGKVELVNIEGLTIENRAACGKAIPDDVMEELKTCPVILKGPTTTPKAGDPWPNIESANVAMRKGLDLFANVRPVKVAEKGIDWRFFRENTEGGYAVGSLGSNVTDELAVDFTIATDEGCERICRLAFEYAKNNGRKRVTCVTKANIIKATDGKFLRIFYNMAKEYPDIQVDDWFIDIMTAKLVDEKRRTQFDVFVMPNLYGDILTDEAAEFQGGVGTAGSANIGKKYAMFEAIHGSAPRMVEEGRDIYADPSSMLRAVVMLLEHIGKQEKAQKLTRALDICTAEEKALVITGRDTGATTAEFADYVISKL
ncbi:MAG: isocitrate/isopropylmalate dehydrogenase family protein [Clostridia bacterium]|nr:isocitrate/isopropylmalate dehydrogenase family protein [Clostridia bacterium]MBQ6990852.1 isocitrate/isopropylmalate dehydrogenase family protein [Clostridia bacterium]